MTLNIEQVNIIDVHNLKKHIKEAYGKDVDLIKEHARYSGNNSFVNITVTAKEPDEGWWPAEESLWDNPDLAISKWLDGDDSVNANEALILWDMCRKGLIPEGDYLMKVWW